jgi:hypothetical protein
LFAAPPSGGQCDFSYSSTIQIQNATKQILRLKAAL